MYGVRSGGGDVIWEGGDGMCRVKGVMVERVWEGGLQQPCIASVELRLEFRLCFYLGGGS